MSRPIRFLHLTTFFPPYNFGGDGIYVYRLTRALAERGHLVDVVHCIDSFRLFDRRDPASAFPDHPGVTVHGLRSRFGSLSPLLSHQAGFPLLQRGAIRQVLRRPVDVIHFHNVSLFGPGVLGIGGRRAPVVRLYTTHEHWLVCPMHVLWKFDREACRKPTCLRCTLAARRPPQWWRYTNLIHRATGNIDRFLAPSEFTVRMHAERGFRRPLKQLAPFADRRDDDWRRPAARPHDRPYFLFVGRLEPVKGLGTLFRLWDRVEEADLVVVGDGSERELLASAAARNPRIVARGALPPGELGPYFFHAIATIVPSVTYEVAPTVVLESFARKTPVIGRDLGGIPEFIRESQGGLVFGTDDELRDAVGRLAAGPDLRRDLGENGYRCFNARWTEEAHLNAYLDLVDEVASEKLGRVPWRAGAAASPALPRQAVESA